MTNTHTASLSIWKDRFIYTSAYFSGEESCRPSTVILIGTDGEFEVESSGNIYRGRALLIGSNVSRTLRASNTGHYSLAETTRCHSLDTKFNYTSSPWAPVKSPGQQIGSR